MARAGTHLLIIDAQNDFCDLPEAACPVRDGQRLLPALPVAGAHDDMLRLAGFIDTQAARLDAICLTLDSHHHFDIGHPAFWCDASGMAPPPFTPIHAADVRAGHWLPRAAHARERVLAYLGTLEATGRYTHRVWPAHCELGSWGHGVHGAVFAACQRWEALRLRATQHVLKGLNPWTEHYSAVMAEVPDPADPATARNEALLDFVAGAARVVIAGEAGSHCVRATVEHLVAFSPRDVRARFVLLEDCMSPVAGFEPAQAEFLAAMREAGVAVMRAAAAAALPDAEQASA
ncbi:MAG: cysteine hydrolase [Candidatus Dactylopiibacterium sp.]|nr:cysteine hydrolase [Candidatus Dactylopiibacterium sp.]